ncbi:MAG: DUF4430 domain-containing protein [Clostridia bacterium]|nr:DUF4430 domain-containing protein [Clostridia bacterium]
MKTNQNKVLSLVLALMMLFSMSACTNSTSDEGKTTKQPQTSQPSKTITVEVVKADETKKSFTINTDEEFLRGALEQEKLVSGTESEYGLFIKTVDGYKVDDSKQEWWCITKGGEAVNTGVDSTPIADADSFEITLTVGF